VVDFVILRTASNKGSKHLRLNCTLLTPWLLCALFSSRPVCALWHQCVTRAAHCSPGSSRYAALPHIAVYRGLQCVHDEPCCCGQQLLHCHSGPPACVDSSSVGLQAAFVGSQCMGNWSNGSTCMNSAFAHININPALWFVYVHTGLTPECDASG
jgi:hypothetical protein